LSSPIICSRWKYVVQIKRRRSKDPGGDRRQQGQQKIPERQFPWKGNVNVREMILSVPGHIEYILIKKNNESAHYPSCRLPLSRTL